MKIEVIDAGKAADENDSCGGCREWGFLLGCCLVHFWSWDAGHGLCC